MLRRYGTRSFSQQGEDLVLRRILERVLTNWPKNGTYLDVGSYHAIEDSVTYALYRQGWSGFAFDPSFDAQKSFRKFRRRDNFVRTLIGKTNEASVPLWIPKKTRGDLSRSSTVYPDIVTNFREDSAQMRTLSDLCSHWGVTHADFMNLDVEGAEMDVLEGINFDSLTIDVIAIEIHGNELEKGLASEPSKFLTGKGYVAVASTVITYFFVRRDVLSVSQP